MAGNITVSSTTDTQDAVNAAARYGVAAETVEPEVETDDKETETREAETPAEPEPAKPPEQDEPDEEEEAEPESKSRRKLNRKVLRLHSELDEARERIRKLEAEKGGKPDEAPAPQGKPTRDQFKTDEAFVEALADYRIAEREKQRAEQERQAYAQMLADDYNQQVETARTTHEDFDEVIDSDAKIPQLAIDVMKEMENGAEVAYYVAKHPEVREKLLEWNEPYVRGGGRKIISTLDSIADKLNGGSSSPSPPSEAPKPRPAVARPPAPIKPVGGASPSRSTVEPDSLSYRDYKKWRIKGGGS